MSVANSKVVMVPDSERKRCVNCSKHFTAFRRRHHCRGCGEIFCNACAPGRKLDGKKGKAVRYCDSCVALRYLVGGETGDSSQHRTTELQTEEVADDSEFVGQSRGRATVTRSIARRDKRHSVRSRMQFFEKMTQQAEKGDVSKQVQLHLNGKLGNDVSIETEKNASVGSRDNVDPELVLPESFKHVETTKQPLLYALEYKTMLDGAMKARGDAVRRARDLSVFAGTYNVAGKKPKNHDMSDYLLDPIAAYDEAHPEAPLGKPDLYVLAWQELVPLNAINLLVENHGREKIWLESVEETLGEGYSKVGVERLVGLLIVVYAKKHEVAPFISSVKTDRVGVGIMGIGGNKGGVAVRMRAFDTSVCFICTHLAAKQKNISSRNSNFHSLVNEIRFPAFAQSELFKMTPLTNSVEYSSEGYGSTTDVLNANIHGSVSSQASDTLLASTDNLNEVRTSASISSTSPSNSISPSSSLTHASLNGLSMRGLSTTTQQPSRVTAASLAMARDISALNARDSFSHLMHREAKFRQILDYEHVVWLGDLNYRIAISDPILIVKKIQNEQFEELMHFDQLTDQMNKHMVFNGWKEGVIDFAPTYRYKIGKHEYNLLKGKKGKLKVKVKVATTSTTAVEADEGKEPSSKEGPSSEVKEAQQGDDEEEHSEGSEDELEYTREELFAQPKRIRTPAWCDRILTWNHQRKSKEEINSGLRACAYELGESVLQHTITSGRTAAFTIDAKLLRRDEKKDKQAYKQEKKEPWLMHMALLCASQDDASPEGLERFARCQQLVYERVERVDSDHKPVYSLVRIKMHSVDEEKLEQLYCDTINRVCSWEYLNLNDSLRLGSAVPQLRMHNLLKQMHKEQIYQMKKNKKGNNNKKDVRTVRTASHAPGSRTLKAFSTNSRASAKALSVMGIDESGKVEEEAVPSLSGSGIEESKVRLSSLNQIGRDLVQVHRVAIEAQTTHTEGNQGSTASPTSAVGDDIVVTLMQQGDTMCVVMTLSMLCVFRQLTEEQEFVEDMDSELIFAVPLDSIQRVADEGRVVCVYHFVSKQNNVRVPSVASFSLTEELAAKNMTLMVTAFLADISSFRTAFM
jgi:hypothetical protein